MDDLKPVLTRGVGTFTPSEDDAWTRIAERAHRRARRRRLVAAGLALLIAGTGFASLVVTFDRDSTQPVVKPSPSLPPEPSPGPTPSPEPSVSDEPAGNGSGVRACDAPAGSVNDVAGEPNWRRFADYVDWTTDEGCLVRIDVIAERPGPSHCEWEGVQVLITGEPLGSRYGRGATTVHYIRDPEGIWSDQRLVEGFDPDATLPTDAIDSGLRSEGRSLWTAPSDPDAAYLVGSESVERWPAGEQRLCA